MKVFEIAKKVGVSSLEVLKEADALGIEAYSSLSIIEPDDSARLQVYFTKRGSGDKERSQQALLMARAGKFDSATAKRARQDEVERVKLEAGRQRALEMDKLVRTKANAVASAPAPAIVAPVPVADVTPAPADVTPATTPPPALAAVTGKGEEVKSAGDKATPATQKAQPVAKPVTPQAAPVKAAPAQAAPTRAAPTQAAPVKAAPVKTAPVAPPPTKSVPKTKTSRFVEDDLDPVEAKAAKFVDRIGRDVTRDAPKPPRASQMQKGGSRERDMGRMQQRGAGAQRGGAAALQRTGQRGAVPARGAQPTRGVQPQEQTIAPDRILYVRGAVVVKDLAEMLGLRPNRLIADLMQLNILASINQRVELDVAQKIADKYGYKVEVERAKRSTERRPVLRSEDADDDIPEDKSEEMLPRPPVVTFLGHVDHGKTSLMDRIRNAHVVKGEAGGITQHIGAYTVELNGRKITFLDTPGHAAFSAMRARGAMLTDIAVIIIAADDGIMPQTREAIRAAQQAGVQIMVAINKCDKPEAKPDRVRQMLQGEGLTPEEWGGDIICSEVSAITGKGVDHLLEMILLQTDVMELTANPNRRADGYVIEAQLAQGHGPTASVLVMGGTLNVGDIILCGEHFGRVRNLIDDRGRHVKSALPATAVKCTGLSGVPEAGAPFRVMLNDKRARELAEKFAEERKVSQLSNTKASSLDALMNQFKDTQKRELGVIVKADTQGSSEAICESLKEIKSEKVSLNIIYEGIGNVCASDVIKASAGKAVIVGFSVSCDAGVQQQARHEGVRISTFRIIYELLDFVKQRMLDLLPPEYKEVVKGHAEIRAIFDIGKTGRVAGCQMLDGVVLADGLFRVLRKDAVIWQGKLESLKHFQNEVAQVTSSQECGIRFADFEGFQTDDTIECYVLEELPRTL